LRIEDRQFPSLQLTQQNGRFADVSATHTSKSTEAQHVLVDSDFIFLCIVSGSSRPRGRSPRRLAHGLSARSGYHPIVFHSGAGSIALDHRQIALPLGIDFSSLHFNTGPGNTSSSTNLQGPSRPQFRREHRRARDDVVRPARSIAATSIFPTIVGIQSTEPGC